MQNTPLKVDPHEIYDDLRRVVLGQDDALREVSVAIVKHLFGHTAGNILLVGNSGSGKTTLMRAVESYLARRPELAHYSNVIRINASVLAQERGGYGRAVLTRLYQNALKKLGPNTPIETLLKWVERGIVFIDEVDKTRAVVSGAANPTGIIAQEALLTLMENENVEFEVTHPLPATLSVNSSSILFVAGGAFEEMYETVYRRAIVGSDGDPLKPTVVVSATGELREEINFHLRNYMKYDDLFAYGMTPQFISRFESIVVLNDLTENELARIFIEPENSIFRTSREYFARFGVDLQITRGAMQLIAWEASRQKRLGARALKEAYRRIARGLEFEPRRAAQKDGSNILRIDEEMVRAAFHSKEQGTSRTR